MDESLRCAIALTRIPGIGPITAKSLVQHCGGLEAIFRAPGRRLRQVPGIGDQLARRILASRDPARREADAELSWLAAHPAVRPLSFLDPAYPDRLRHIPDSPIVLYYRGSIDLNTPRVVGIVGTRRPSPYGQKHAEALVRGFRAYDVVVVSGLAYGVDAIVHRTCLEHGTPTLGVLGHGMRQIYPRAHRRMARQMTERGGLLTEFVSHLGPEKDHFPMRNRIIAGLCDALVVVATGVRGGSVISAEFANAYDRDVYALPGPIGDSGSEGCHRLIRTHRAGLIESAEDLATQMDWRPEGGAPSAQGSLFDDLAAPERALIQVIRGKEAVHIDELSRELRIPGPQLATRLLHLECQGLLRSLPGNRYTLRE